MSGDGPPYRQLVFSGGGTRCFWQGGFLHVVRDALGLDPERVSGVSGGALSGSAFITRRGLQLLETMSDAFDRQDDNFDWNQLTDGDTAHTPHQRVYREVVSSVLDDEAQRRVAEGPSFQVLIAHPPDDKWASSSGSAATIAYEAELHLKSTPHFNWAERGGLDCTLVDARQAAADGRLVDLVCAAATIPPLFDVPRWDGRPVIDGGMADQAPMPAPDEGRTLVLLTRQYRNLPEVEGRRYVAPSDETPADKIDFTDPAKVRRTWELGERDGRAFLDTLD